ncbi:hypothetical protein FQN53_007898 [Emmonsiellopsis sp. PD_33]|nr:hypothetical protein FQN53_007898 [Emmonsiellopsis sp. PD_33]
MRKPWTLIVPEGMNTDVEVVFNNILEMAMARAFESPPSKTLEHWFGLPDKDSSTVCGSETIVPGQEAADNGVILVQGKNKAAATSPESIFQESFISVALEGCGCAKRAVRRAYQRIGKCKVAENNKLAGESNYAIWRNVFETKIVLIRAADIISQRQKTLPEDIDEYSSEVEIWRYKLRHVWEALYDSLKQDVMLNVQVALTSLGGMGDPVTPWEWLEDAYQTHAEDFQHKFFQRITTISINECGGDIVTHVTNWRKAVENLTRRGNQEDVTIRTAMQMHIVYGVKNFTIASSLFLKKDLFNPLHANKHNVYRANDDGDSFYTVMGLGPKVQRSEQSY